MRVLIIGGTGLISQGIVKHLLARGAEVVMYNRGLRDSVSPAGVEHIAGDRNDVAAFEARLAGERFDVVIDMICFTEAQAESAIRAFSGRCEHFILCSTVCVYGVEVPGHVLIDERFDTEPVFAYGHDKLASERRVLQAGHEQRFHATVIRPSTTYGPGSPLIDQLEMDPVAWDRIERGLPVLCGGDGLGLCQATHRDDVGKLFAYAALNPTTYGQIYNATRDEVFTWADYYRQAALALGARPRVLFMPARWIAAHDPARFFLLTDVTQYHGAYSSRKARGDVPEFRCEIGFVDGARATLLDPGYRARWRDGAGDALYEAMVQKALGLGVAPLEL